MRGLPILTVPFNLCANVALLSLKGIPSSGMEVSGAVNTKAPDEDALVAGTKYHFLTTSTEV